jgi:ATP-dependent Clp protease ATP-binding subunit ClpB
MLNKELKLLKGKGYHLEVGAGVLDLLVSQGVEPRLGVRRMRATAETQCRHAVREALMTGRPTSGTLVAENGHLVIHS